MRKTLVSIIAVCVLTVIVGTSVFALEGSVNSLSQGFTLYTNSGGSTLSYQIQATALHPYIIDLSNYETVNSITPTNNGQGTYSQHVYSQYETVVCQPIVIMVRLANNTSTDLAISQGYYSFTVSTQGNTSSYIPPDDYGNDVQLIGGNLSDVITTLSSNGSIQLRWSSKFTYNSGLVIPAKSVLYDQIVYYRYSYYNTPYDFDSYPGIADQKISAINLLSPSSDKVSVISDFTLMNADYNSINQVALLQDIYNETLQLYQLTNNKLSLTNNLLNSFQSANHTDLVQIHNDLQAILDAYTNNASNITDTNSQIDSTQSTVDYVHSQEQTWYAANQSAIEETGLSNARLSDNQYQGVYPVANDFNQLWIAIGPTKWIYLFTLMCSLAAFMLRHKPFSHAGAEIGYQTRSAARQERRLNK